MSKKTLNAENLKALGAARLADLLIEVSTGSADIKRRLRLELSHNLGPAELARDVRKRLLSLRKAKSYVGWRKRKALIKDLTTQSEMITDKIAPEDPTTAFALLWEFVELAPFIHARVDDSRGDVGDVYRAALARFAEIGPRALVDRDALAARIWDALSDNGYGEFDGLIGVLGPTLGPDGLQALKTLVLDRAQRPPEPPEEDHEALRFLRNLRGASGNHEAERQNRLIKMCLQQIAEAEGDVDAYIAQYSAQDLTRPSIAAEVAQLLLTEGRAEDALDTLSRTDIRGSGAGRSDWDAAYIACLLALGRVEDAQAYRLTRFGETLQAEFLRDYLKLLPDFDDVEAEEAAKAQAQSFENVHRALVFFLHWPDLSAAARLIETRADELDGDFYDILAPAAQALRDKHPLAAVILWRKMIDYALGHGRSTRYGHAADHLMDCTAVDADIADYGPLAPHHIYLLGLQACHDRKASFWQKVR